MNEFGLDSRIFLDPMAGITDKPMRQLVSSFGKGNIVSEMVAINAIQWRNPKTYRIADVRDEKYPVIVQLVGGDPQLFGETVKLIEDLGAAAIDINMGCPVPKVAGNGEGSALMKKPDLAGRIVRRVTDRVSIPVTVKFRKGFDEDHVNAVEFAVMLEENGASSLAVHGRTREQYYSGKADWEIIRQVKAALHIPVIGNGDVTDGESARKMFEETGCDGVMVARAAQGNPFLFREIKSYFENGETCPPPTTQEIYDTIIRHADLQLKYKGEYIGIREMRKHVSWYTYGMPGSAKFRNMINQMEDMDSLKKACRELFEV